MNKNAKTYADRRRKSHRNAQSRNLLWTYTGFLVRRVWQIHVAMFLEDVKVVTPVQFSILQIARRRGGCDQGSLATDVGIDRSNAADILARLERKGLISRSRGKVDRRESIVRLTKKGQAFVRKIEGQIRRSHRRLVEDLSAHERKQFKSMLERIASAKNNFGRTPMKLLGLEGGKHDH